VYQFEQNDPSPFNLTVEEMGEVRYKEMLTVEKTLHLSSMTVLDFPDGGLKEVDPREIEKVIRDHIQKLEANILITYPVHRIDTV
jgi:LmbE family N-acetylglucosaminyl deacetylase